MQKLEKKTLSKDYNIVENISFLVKKVIAPNPSPFTLHGTGTFLIGRERVCIIDPGPLIESHVNNILKAVGKKTISHIYMYILICHHDIIYKKKF